MTPAAALALARQVFVLWTSTRPIKTIRRGIRKWRNNRRERKGLPKLEPIDGIDNYEGEMMNEQLASLIRTVAKFGAGFLVARGWIDASMVEPIIGAVLAVAGVWWSYKSHDPTSTIK